MHGIVTHIQRFSLHDGPGIRTTVFLKGCNMRCFWCHNPETWAPAPELQTFPARCIACGACVSACPQGAHTLVEGVKGYDRAQCVACGQCAEVCYADALVLTGKVLTVADVLAEVLADRAFYATSGGGVTLSGGEPALQPDFAYAILAGCKAEGIHTAIETAAHYAWERLEKLLAVTDFVMTDIKHMDAEKHRAVTGVSNAQILANHRRLMATDKPVVFRTPVVPTVNATPAEIGAIAAYIRDLAALRAQSGSSAPPPSLELLPFHRMAEDKYRSLGLAYKAQDLPMPTQEEMAALVTLAAGYGIAVKSS